MINIRPSSEKDCERIVEETVRSFGRIDILVVASGINKVSKVDEMSPDTFKNVMDVNVTQSWLMAREVTKQMKLHPRLLHLTYLSASCILLLGQVWSKHAN